MGAQQRAVVLRGPRRQRRRGADDLLGGVAGEGAQRRVDLEDPAAHVGDDHAVADRAEQARAAGDHPPLAPEALLHDRADEGEDDDDQHRAAPRRGRVVRPADGDERHGEDEGDADQRADEMGAAAVERDPEDREEREDAVPAERAAGSVAQDGDDDEPEEGRDVGVALVGDGGRDDRERRERDVQRERDGGLGELDMAGERQRGDGHRAGGGEHPGAAVRGAARAGRGGGSGDGGSHSPGDRQPRARA